MDSSNEKVMSELDSCKECLVRPMCNNNKICDKALKEVQDKKIILRWEFK